MFRLFENSQSCLMQHEPEAEVCFSRKMSLKAKRIRMLGIDHPHGRRKEVEPGADPGISGREPRSSLSGQRAGGVIRVGGADSARAWLWRPEAQQQGTGAALYRQDDGPETSTSDAPGGALSERWGGAPAALPAPPFCEPLHGRRCRTAGGGGRGTPELEWAGHAKDSAAGLSRLSRRALPTPGAIVGS